MSAYVSRAALKEAIGQGASDTTDDAKIDSIVFRASALVDAYLDTTRGGYVGFAAGSNARSSVGSNTRYYDGNNDDWLFIDDHSSVSSVTVDDVAVDSDDYVTWPYNEGPIRALVYKEPVSSVGLTPAHWTRGTRNVAVAGFAGFNIVPSEVEACTVQLGILIWRRYERGEDAGGEFATIADPEVRAVLATYLVAWTVPHVGGA